MTITDRLVNELELEVEKTGEMTRTFILSEEELSAIVGYIRALEEEAEEFGKTSTGTNYTERKSS